MIAVKMREQGGIEFSGEKYANKWKSNAPISGRVSNETIEIVLTTIARGVEMVDRKKCKHFEELNQLFGNKPSTQPVFVTDTSSRSHSSSSHGSDCSSSHSSFRIYRVPYNSAAALKSDSDSSLMRKMKLA